MSWYHLLSPLTEKWVALGVFVVVFALILMRKYNIAYISLAGAGLLIFTGIMNPAGAFLSSIAWDALAIYWGYYHLAVSFRDSGMPGWIANWILPRAKEERYALLFLCLLAMFFSSFMANPVVVIMLAPPAIEIATRLKGSLFLYMVALAISANAVTTVSMIADPRRPSWPPRPA
ncbi:MAG: SLC13 family permease [Dehalococcoidales bacterium]|nr:SLC13 family permease [Dehalococcoidales bacterium]